MIEELFGAGAFALLGGLLLFLFIIGIAMYVYTALAFMKVADKLNHPNPWLAWIPIANLALVLQLGGFHWALVFLILIPYAGGLVVGVLSIIALFHVAEKLNVIPAWTAFLCLIPGIGQVWYLILIGILAWKE